MGRFLSWFLAGALPCPALSTFNALKYLQAHPDLMAKAEPRAKAQMERVISKGVQVEWLECESFLQWQVHVETSSVQASVQVSPHVIDTALKYLTFCSSAQAVAPGKQSLDEGFTNYLQGNRAHRLKEAKTLLNNSEPAVIAEVAKWRNGGALRARELVCSSVLSDYRRMAYAAAAARRAGKQHTRCSLPWPSKR